ncbi:Gfo/Idh/MocA family oxidoreductase [Pelagicoccus sp. SDUM812002]|uniref:Gfo/Idh/MocA family protein n=1 Tax=Pelagicoccus sp. SDUM812002 TaxID=3041266 RepID=UPI00280DCF8F|nr:Gfo/Idh/MocA family oxidoreductase [Pelagicoccus sp. SDUM812002]MDQ8188380.1 Gfo/Idh/MocA family oxidoreductase [Pelagicoccus sp. SDUM812002]
MTKDVRVGIIGLGNMGSAHARMIAEGKVPGLRLAAVADVRAEVAEKFPETTFFESGSELIRSGLVDAVVVCTPHFDHTRYGIECLDAGLHLLVEKPISVHKADCERLIKASEGKDVVFAAMFNQRTDPAYKKLKHLIESGELGEIERVQWTITDWYRPDVYYSSGGWRATWAGEGGGVLMNQCPHQLDLWQWLFGMPETIWAECQIGRFHDIEVEDSVTAVMKYSDGKRGVLITTTGEAPGTNRLEVACSRGRVVLENGKIEWLRNEVENREFLRTTKNHFGKPDLWRIEIPFENTGEQHLGVLKNFAKAILEGETLIAPAAEGMNSVELCNAMLLSSAEGAEVRLPMDSVRYERLLKERIAASKPKEKVDEQGAVDSEEFAKSF